MNKSNYFFQMVDGSNGGKFSTFGGQGGDAVEKLVEGMILAAKNDQLGGPTQYYRIILWWEEGDFSFSIKKKVFFKDVITEESLRKTLEELLAYYNKL